MARDMEHYEGIARKKMGKKAWNCHMSVVCTLDVGMFIAQKVNFKNKMQMRKTEPGKSTRKKISC